MSYPKTFRTYIQRTITYALAQVQEYPYLLPDDVNEQALHALDYGFDFEDGWESVRTLLLAMSPRMEQAGLREDWLRYLRKGVDCSQSHQDQRTAGKLELDIAMLHRMLSDFEPAQTWVQSAIAKAEEVNDSSLVAKALNELAWIEQLKHDYENATIHAQAALALSAENDIERGMAFRVLGMVAWQKKQFEEAEALHRSALAIFQQNHDIRRSAWSLQNLALALRMQKKFDEAFISFQQAADALKQIGDLYHWAVVKMNLGAAYFHYEMPQIALLHYQEAEYQAVLNRDVLQLANVCNCLGLDYLKLKQFTEAEQYFTKAISLFKKLADDEWRLNNMDGLAMVYLAQGKFIQAQQLLESAIADLHLITESASYEYLDKSLNEHLEQAKRGQDSTNH